MREKEMEYFQLPQMLLKTSGFEKKNGDLITNFHNNSLLAVFMFFIVVGFVIVFHFILRFHYNSTCWLHKANVSHGL